MAKNLEIEKKGCPVGSFRNLSKEREKEIQKPIRNKQPDQDGTSISSAIADLTRH
jgi:hypothetical protein